MNIVPWTRLKSYGDAQRLRIRLHKVLRHQSSHRGLAADQLQVIQGQPVLDLPQ